MKILGIETSCDETGIAIYDSKEGLLAHQLHSQISTHQPFGGTVPELASRDHIQKIALLTQKTLELANLSESDLDGIAYTAGPGLMGALLVGSCFAKAFSFACNIPAIAIHHMEGHLLAPLLEVDKPTFPFVALLVSGGHTMLVEVKGLGQYLLLGETIDDAAGESFDKVARLLNLPYPGGPAIEKIAHQGNKTAFDFPRPLTQKPGLDFSFSGLKTATRRVVEQKPLSVQRQKDIAASFQAAVIDTLTLKCERALKKTGLTQLVIAGGVGANRVLRASLSRLMAKRQGKIFYPRLAFCTDNGAMIAFAGCLRMQQNQQDPNLSVEIYPKWSLEDQVL